MPLANLIALLMLAAPPRNPIAANAVMLFGLVLMAVVGVFAIAVMLAGVRAKRQSEQQVLPSSTPDESRGNEPRSGPI